jgi:plasmid stabilization system protein ParE
LKFKLVFLEEAQADVRDASKWYEDQSPGLGKQFIKAIRAALKSIGTTPFGFSSRSSEFRAIPLKKFPYLLYYLLDETNGLLVVFAVLHTHRNPSLFEKRIRKRE